MGQYTVQQAGAVALAVLVVGSTLIGPATAAVPLLGERGTEDPAVIEYTVDGEPYDSYLVTLDQNATDSLRTWANATEAHHLIDTYPEHDMAVVAAPAAQIQDIGIWGDGLSLSTAERVQALAGSVVTEQLIDESYVVRVEPNYRVSVDRPEAVTWGEFEPPTVGRLAYNDPKHPLDGIAFDGEADRGTINESREHINATTVSATGDDITIAVIDTGANVADGELFGNGSSGSAIRLTNDSYDYVEDESVDATADDYEAVEDPNGHGTWVAAAIAANHSDSEFDGVAPDATLTVKRALDEDGSGSTADIVAAIRDAAAEGADVISMSLGSPLYSAELERAVQNATEQGSVMVIAAGNSRITRGANIGSPADVDEPGVLTVASTSVDNATAANVSYFSQVGPDPGTEDVSDGASQGATPDVAAPGQNITVKVTTVNGGLENSTLSGTSMATPQVAGGVGVALAANATLADQDPGEIETATKQSAVAMPNAAAVEVGHGQVDVATLADGRRPLIKQRKNMDDAATQRDRFYRAESDASGGVLARLLS